MINKTLALLGFTSLLTFTELQAQKNDKTPFHFNLPDTVAYKDMQNNNEKTYEFLEQAGKVDAEKDMAFIHHVLGYFGGKEIDTNKVTIDKFAYLNEKTKGTGSLHYFLTSKNPNNENVIEILIEDKQHDFKLDVSDVKSVTLTQGNDNSFTFGNMSFGGLRERSFVREKSNNYFSEATFLGGAVSPKGQTNWSKYTKNADDACHFKGIELAKGTVESQIKKNVATFTSNFSKLNTTIDFGIHKMLKK